MTSVDRAAPLHRHAEVAAHGQAHPLEVLDVDRLIEPVLDAEVLGLLLRDRAS